MKPSQRYRLNKLAEEAAERQVEKRIKTRVKHQVWWMTLRPETQDIVRRYWGATQKETSL